MKEIYHTHLRPCFLRYASIAASVGVSESDKSSLSISDGVVGEGVCDDMLLAVVSPVPVRRRREKPFVKSRIRDGRRSVG